MMACVDAKISSPIIPFPLTPLPVEESGDSDEPFDPFQLPTAAGCGALAGSAVEDDDTESCNSDNHCGLEFCVRGLDGGNGSDDNECDDSEQEEEEASEGGRDQYHEGPMSWPPAGGLALVSEEPEDLDEAEKNKIFWEKCLQSGYP